LAGFDVKKNFIKLAVFSALFLLFIIIIVSIIIRNRSIEEEFLAPVITIKPFYGSLEKTLRITSQVETGKLITLTPRVGGTLVLLNVKAGDEVKEGEVVARIDSAPYDINYLQAQSAFVTARSTYERIRQVFQTQGVSRQSYDEARMAFDVARAQFELAGLNRDYTNIRSPMDATVLMRHGTEGGLVGAGTALLTLGDLNDLRIKAAIPEIHYRFFAENWETMPVSIQVPALGDEGTFSLKPFSLAPYVSPENRSFLVEYEIPYGAVYGLRPGMFVNVIFTLEKKEMISYLPFKVLASGNRLWYVTEDQDNQAFYSSYIEFTPEFFNNDYFQIPADLSARVFIIEGQHFIRQGQRLNVLNRDFSR